MFFIVISLIIIVAAIVIGFLSEYNDGYSGVLGSLLFGFLSGLIAAFVLAVVNIPIQYGMYRAVDHKDTPNEYPLVALGDNQQTVGRFFLGSGSIDGEAVFYYYRDEGEGYVRRQAPADATTIYYTKDEPRVVFYDHDAKSSFWTIWDAGYTWEFYIPEGSISNDYALDNQ